MSSAKKQMKCLKALVKNTHCGETNVSKKKKSALEKTTLFKHCGVFSAFVGLKLKHIHTFMLESCHVIERDKSSPPQSGQI